MGNIIQTIAYRKGLAPIKAAGGREDKEVVLIRARWITALVVRGVYYRAVVLIIACKRMPD